jgi:hypothetical protein
MPTRRSRAEARPVGTQRVGEHERIASVVLGTGDRVAVAEPVQLLRVDGVHVEPAFDETLRDGAARDLDRDGDTCGLALTEPGDLVDEASDRRSVVLDLALRH